MRLRLFAGFAFLVLVTLGTVALFVYQGAQSQVRGFFGRGGIIGAEDLVTDLETYFQQYQSWDGVEAIMPGKGRQGNGHGDGKGNTDQASGKGGLTDLRLADADGVIVYDPLGVIGSQVSDADQIGIPLHAGNQVAGYLLPQIGSTFPAYGLEEEILTRINQALLSAALIAGALSLLLALGMAYLIIRPVNQLTRAAARLSLGDLKERVSIRSRDELGLLGRTFNQMAESLENASENRKMMTADIAHELRTPLAVQQAHLEAMQDGIYPLTRENLQVVLAQNRLLSRLVNDLRMLALADAGELKLDKIQANLSSIVKDTVDQFQAQAKQAGIRIHLDIQRCPLVKIDPTRIQQIFQNLLHNSLRYTPDGGEMFVLLSWDGQAVQLQVHDSGPGIPEDSLPHIFERFYRADRSRARDEGGTGLGLAIARGLAEAHGGTLTAANHPHGGAIFTLRIPNRL